MHVALQPALILNVCAQKILFLWLYHRSTVRFYEHCPLHFIHKRCHSAIILRATNGLRQCEVSRFGIPSEYPKISVYLSQISCNEKYKLYQPGFFSYHPAFNWTGNFFPQLFENDRLSCRKSLQASLQCEQCCP